MLFMSYKIVKDNGGGDFGSFSFRFMSWKIKWKQNTKSKTGP